jgi:hypothetical protein
MTTAFDFSIPVPTDELNAKPSSLLPNGWYLATFGGGAELLDNGNGWQGIKVPLSGFVGRDGKTYDRDRRYQVTVASSSQAAVDIGRRQLVEAAQAFGLAEDTTVNGKPAKRLTCSTPAEFVEQLNALAGTPVDVYVTTKARKRNGQPVMRDDGAGPVMDNEVSRIAAAGTGK